MASNNQNPAFLAASQYATAAGVEARFDLYKNCVPAIDIHQKALDALSLNGKETLLELGCASGYILLNLREKRGHRGKLIGLDINDTIMQPTVDYLNKHPDTQPITFMTGSADKLALPDESVDVIVGFFMLYHMPDVQRTLKEWSRVLRPGGRILVSTGSYYNRPKAKVLRETMARIAGTTTHKRFSDAFDLENGRQQLEKVFKIVDEYIYDGELRSKDAESQLKSIDSTRDMAQPAPTDKAWSEARAYAGKLIQSEIEQNGYFCDRVCRGYFIAKKSEE